VQLLPGISCCRLTNDANQVGCSRAFGEPQALFDSHATILRAGALPRALSNSQAR